MIPFFHRLGRGLAVALALLVCPAAHAESPEPEGIPLLVSIDDLPLAGAFGYHVDPEERARLTRELLAVLAKHEITAVGLVTWGNVRYEGDRELLAEWLAAGHELGNHSYGHLSYTRTDSATYLADLEKARREIAALLGEHGQTGPRFFRFPMLREGDTPEKFAAARSYLEETEQRNLPVTFDNQDWWYEQPWVVAVKAGDEAEQARVAESYQESMHVSIRHHEMTSYRLFGRKPAQILLLHANSVGAAQWDRLFTWLRDRGYRFASADEVLADPAFAEPVEYIGIRGPGLWDRMLDQQRRDRADAAIRKLLADQAAAWSRGDLEAFVTSYADDTLFVSPSGVTRGRDEVLARYRRRYPDRAAMGTLTLDIQELRLTAGPEISMLGDARPGDMHGARVVARWTLTYPDGAERDTATGLTLIVFERRGAHWVIVEDASM